MISVGRRCLIGANAGIGISLGDDCVVEAGTYVTAGSKVSLPDGTVVKAGRCPDRTVCCSGATASPAPWRCARAAGTGSALNDALHAN